MNARLPETWQRYVRTVACVLIALYSVGFAGHLFSPTASWMRWLTPFSSLWIK